MCVMTSRRSAAAAALILLGAAAAPGAAPLFPRPIHLVRSVTDGITGRTTTLDEYCSGDRVVTVSGTTVSILDQSVKTVTVIDHEAASWSVTTFEEAAAAREAVPAPANAGARPWRRAEATAASAGLRESYALVAEEPDSPARIELTIDRNVAISREALEVLLGAAYPARRSVQQDAVIAAAAAPHGGRASVLSSPVAAYGIPAVQILTVDGHLVARNIVVRVDDAVVPPALLAIDPGARRIESDLVRFARELTALDRIPSQKKP